jgi:hypothetical protein
MKKVCLKVGLSYATRGFSCVKGSSCIVDDTIAAKIQKTGRFEIADVEFIAPEPVASVPEPMALVSEPADSPLKAANITSMKKDELIAFAEAHGINIEDCKNNEERIQRIQSEMDLGVFVRLASEE